MNINKSTAAAIVLVISAIAAYSQKSINTELEIVRAEDELRYDTVIEHLLKYSDEKRRIRAALAAGRVGDEAAVPALSQMLETDVSDQARVMAAFALGEIESIAATDAILQTLRSGKTTSRIRARAVEAAGKIAAANSGDEKAKLLGEAILDTLEAEERKGGEQDRDTVLLALTAALRARPPETDFMAAKFLTNRDARIRADAANTLARIRAKNANDLLREIISKDSDAIVRANAARALGAAEDTKSGEALLNSALRDGDSRVRVSAVRALAQVGYQASAELLLSRGMSLLEQFRSSKKPGFIPEEKNELLEIASAVGRLLAGTGNARAVRFLSGLGEADEYRSPETEIAFAKIAPREYIEYLVNKKPEFKQTRAAVSAGLQGIREFAGLQSESDASIRADAIEQLARGIAAFKAGEKRPDPMSMPTLLQSYAAFKPDGLEAELRFFLENSDIFLRAAAADLLGDMQPTAENTGALKSAFTKSLASDKHDNDAQLSILSALVKLDKEKARGSIDEALHSVDYLVRRHAVNLIKQNGLEAAFPEFEKLAGPVRAFNPKSGTRLGQVLNATADYRRALARKNGSIQAVLTTQKGSFTIELFPEDAPLTVDNFVKLAQSGYFNGLEVHRVVANFVVQDGDPRGDGNGGPGWSIRDEINLLPYERGAVGMALSGKNTGGSQWFVTHSPQPHLDGGYTVFGRVNETDMKIVDKITRGDRILTVKIITRSPRRK